MFRSGILQAYDSDDCSEDGFNLKSFVTLMPSSNNVTHFLSISIKPFISIANKYVLDCVQISHELFPRLKIRASISNFQRLPIQFNVDRSPANIH